MEKNFSKYLLKNVFVQLKPLEQKRKKIVVWFYICVAIVILADCLVLSLMYLFWFVFLTFLSIFILVVAYKIISKNTKKEFSRKVILNIIKYIDKNLNYDRDAYISPSEYKSSKLFSTNYDYFSGLFYTANFNKEFLGEVYILPHYFRLFKPISDTTKIKLEDPEFNEAFDAYARDPILGMYVISTNFEKKLLDLKKKFNSQLYVSLLNSTLYLAYSKYKPLNIPIFKSVYDKNIYYDYLNSIKSVTEIADELNLNTRVWSLKTN